MMQAFLWRHLVPARALLVSVNRPGRMPVRVVPLEEERLRIPAGGTAEVVLKGGRRPGSLTRARFELEGAPDGLTVRETSYDQGGTDARITLHADAERLAPGERGNLILAGLAKSGKRRRILGMAPAIPFEIVEP
jgi:hypothetical protein